MSDTLDLFAGVLRDIADGPRVSSYQQLTEAVLRRLSEKGATLAQCSERGVLNRSLSTLEKHCREFGIRFPDYTPANMRKHVVFTRRGDFHELSGQHAAEVARALGIVVLKRSGADDTCSIPDHSFPDAKKVLRKAGFEAKSKKQRRKSDA